MNFIKKRNIVLGLTAIFIIVCFSAIISVDFLAHRFYPLEYQGEIKDNAAKYSLEPVQVCAIIYEESKFDPDVVSSKDAIGLMQIMPDTANLLAKEMGIERLWRDDLFVPSVNLKFGTYYFRQLLDRYNGDADLALAAYNAGFGAVDKANKEINNLPRETQEFVKRVKKTEKIYQKLYWQELGSDPGDLGFGGLMMAVWNKIIKSREH